MIDLWLGDCLDIMRGMDADSVDAVVTDPPYGLSFMGKDWDHGVPGIHFWSEALRVAKPGAYLLAFGGTRTYHRLVCAIEDADFEIRDTIEWVYGSGFPKSLDVSKAIDKAAGMEREIICSAKYSGRRNTSPMPKEDGWNENCLSGKYNETIPATDAAREWAGWGTALKPAHEPIVVARKPLSEATVAANVLRWGTGALNIDASRIETDGNYTHRANGVYKKCGGSSFGIGNGVDGTREDGAEIHPQGRFPANLITDGSAEVVAMFPQSEVSGSAKSGKPATRGGYSKPEHLFSGMGNQQGALHNDSGSAARFFKSCPLDEDDYPPLYYCAKASKAERETGCEGMEETESRRYGEQGQGPTPQQTPRTMVKQRNHHPTVKPLSLMRYLITLCTCEGATVLDPFMGSGTTGVACMQLGRNFIGCEIDPQYFEIAKHRIEVAQPVAIELPLMAEA